MAIRGSLNSAPTFATFFGVFVSARPRVRAWFPVASIIALVVLLPTILQAATFTVTSTADAVGATNDFTNRSPPLDDPISAVGSDTAL